MAERSSAILRLCVVDPGLKSQNGALRPNNRTWTISELKVLADSLATEPNSALSH